MSAAGLVDGGADGRPRLGIMLHGLGDAQMGARPAIATGEALTVAAVSRL